MFQSLSLADTVAFEICIFVLSPDLDLDGDNDQANPYYWITILSMLAWRLMKGKPLYPDDIFSFNRVSGFEYSSLSPPSSFSVLTTANVSLALHLRSICDYHFLPASRLYNHFLETFPSKSTMMYMISHRSLENRLLDIVSSYALILKLWSNGVDVS